jgi:hypothetical protein
MSYDYSQHSKEGLIDMLEDAEQTIANLQEDLKTAKTIIEEKNAAIMELKRNKGIDEMKNALTEIALICNAELYEVEQVARRDLAEPYQHFYDIQKLADEALK